MFANNWSTGTGFTQNARPFDDRATRGEGPGAFGNPNWTYWGYVNSDDRKPVDASRTSSTSAATATAAAWAGVSPGVTVRPTSFLSISTGVDWSHNVQDAQWVENTADGRYVFGRLDQTTVSLTLRVNYTITPQLTVQVYAAPFVSAGDYDRLQAARQRPRRAVRGPLRADRRTRPTPTSTTARSAPPTSCAGNTSPARRCSSSGSRDAKTCSTPAASGSVRDFGGVFGAPGAQRVPRQVELLDQTSSCFDHCTRRRLTTKITKVTKVTKPKPFVIFVTFAIL